jgi:hypothetical protein
VARGIGLTRAADAALIRGPVLAIGAAMRYLGRILCLVLVGLAAVLSCTRTPMADPSPLDPPAAAALYPGETLEHAAGFPVLVRFAPARLDSTLLVFITGGGVLARIAYGYPGGRPADFLGHWLQREGLALLALSYPMGVPAFAATYPGFGVADWAEQSAEIIARYVAAHQLPKKVVVLAWSMAGRVAAPLTVRLRQRAVEVELLVAMAASPAMPNLLPGLDGLRPAPSGLARVEGAYLAWLQHCLADQGRLAGHAIVPPDLFAAAFAGDFPVGLAASAMRYEDGAFVHAPQRDADETGAFAYGQYPPIAVLTHDSPVDPHHALVDRAVWGFYMTQQLSQAYLFQRGADITALAPEKWTEILRLVRGAPERLTLTMPGNHMFFVGEAGAAKTVAAVKELRVRAAALASELNAAVR